MLTLADTMRTINHNAKTGSSTTLGGPVHHVEIADKETLINQFILPGEQSQ